MLVVETVAKIRRAYFVQGKAIKAICRELGVSRKVVRKVLRSEATEFRYEREEQPLPRIGPWRAELDRLLVANEAKPGRERLTLIRVFENLRGQGYDGGYDAVRRYARGWQRDRSSTSVDAFVPLSFAPGEAYQFDWSHEVVLINGATVTVKVAHVRLCHSRMLFVRAYPRETQEMVFDAHDRAFAFFKGACTRGIYDNMKTAVETIFVGRERAYNRRFQQMCSHYLVDPVACTPASGWEKGQVENQVGLVRERFFTPRLRVKSYDELNAWLLDQCVAYARARRHPEIREQTIWQMFEAERPSLVPYAGRFDGFHGATASVSKTCLVGSITTNTPSRRARSGGRSRSGLMPIGSSCARPGVSSANIHAALDAIRRCSIPGITCRFSPASRGRCVTARRSRTGSCRPGWTGSAASSPVPPMATGRSSPSSSRC
jgi:transposase